MLSEKWENSKFKEKTYEEEIWISFNLRHERVTKKMAIMVSPTFRRIHLLQREIVKGSVAELRRRNRWCLLGEQRKENEGLRKMGREEMKWREREREREFVRE